MVKNDTIKMATYMLLHELNRQMNFASCSMPSNRFEICNHLLNEQISNAYVLPLGFEPIPRIYKNRVLTVTLREQIVGKTGFEPVLSTVMSRADCHSPTSPYVFYNEIRCWPHNYKGT